MKTIGDMTVSGMHVLMRVDLNVPLDGISVRGSR
jgi:3-phosphoglycerate kinase